MSREITFTIQSLHCSMQDIQGIMKTAIDRMLSWMEMLNMKSRKGIPKDQVLAVVTQGRDSWGHIVL